MKTALILGITGNFGLQMALALKAEGWQIKALIRDPSKAPQWLGKQHILVADALDEPQVAAAASGVDLIVYGLNPAYHRWHSDAMKLLEPSITVAERLGLRLLFPGNVYNFSPCEQRITESQGMRPVSDKGAIRVAMEQRLKLATQRGALVTIVRAGDFIGPNTHLSWLDMLIKRKHGKTTMAFPHNNQHVHYWSYLPDLCHNTAKLMAIPQANFEVWHDPGLALTAEHWQQAFAANGQTLNTRKFAWWGLVLMAPFVPTIKEVLKMRYLWQQPVVLDGEKMKRALPQGFQATPLASILTQLQPET
ncbi:NAD(P)H-binding protein [Agarivorans sp. MS3-6]